MDDLWRMRIKDVVYLRKFHYRLNREPSITISPSNARYEDALKLIKAGFLLSEDVGGGKIKLTMTSIMWSELQGHFVRLKKSLDGFA